MASVVVLPDPALLTLISTEVDETTQMITALAVTTASKTSCPLCQQPSSKILSSYIRTLADLPCFGKLVRWQVQLRRFFCKNDICTRKIFTERLCIGYLSHPFEKMDRLPLHMRSIGSLFSSREAIHTEEEAKNIFPVL
jgi:hypothetical protein